MFVKDQMSSHPIMVPPATTVVAAQQIMKDNRVRHLPVVKSGGVLVGLVTRTSLDQMLPSKLTTLSVHELNYQLSKITVKDAMIRKPITVTEDVPIEQAARVMLENKIGCLPVMRDDRLVGIITDTDLMRTMLEMLGARQPGVRLTLTIPDEEGQLSLITSAIAAEHGDIGAFNTLPSPDPLRWLVVAKVRYVDQDTLVRAVGQLPGIELVDVRTD